MQLGAFRRDLQDLPPPLRRLLDFPIEHTPLLNPVDSGGAPDSPFWLKKIPTLFPNTWIKQCSSRRVSVAAESKISFQGTLEKRWPETTAFYLDVYSLIKDIMASRGEYLQEPVSLTGIYRFCVDGLSQEGEFNEGSLERYS
jgi:hypothetical protein